MLDHLDDITSDMSRFHRVDDIYAMDGPRFFTLASRLSAYPGVMQIRVKNELAEDDTPAGPAGPPPPGRPAAAAPVPLEIAGAHKGFQGDGKGFPPVFEQKRG